MLYVCVSSQLFVHSVLYVDMDGHCSVEYFLSKAMNICIVVRMDMKAC